MESSIHKSHRLYHRAKELYSLGKNNALVTDRVIKDMMKAISLHPNQSNHYIFLARVYRDALDISSAIACLRFALRQDPGSYSVKKRLAEMLWVKGQELFCEAYRFAGNSELEEKKRTTLIYNAKVNFDESMKLGRNDNGAWILKIACHIRLGEKKEALDATNRLVLAQKKALPEVHIFRAKILWAHGLVEEGNKDIRIALQGQPDHPEVKDYTTRSFVKAEKLYNMGLQCFAGSKYKDAISFVSYATSLVPEDIKLHILAAKTHRMMDNLPKAYAAIQKATIIYQSASDFNMELPFDLVRQSNLIFNEMALKFAADEEHDKAIVLFNKVIASERALSRGLTDIDYRFHLNRADCFRMQHKLAPALLDYKAALELHHNGENTWDIKTKISLIHYMNAMDFFNHSGYGAAERELTEAIKYNPKVFEYYKARGKAR